MATEGDWRPILEGAEADRALSAVAVIAEALREPENPWITEPDMAGGHAGAALLFTYRALAEDSDADAETALAYVEQALAQGTDDPQNPTLYSGLVGVAWVIQHLKDRLLEPEEVEEICEVVDRIVLDILGRSPWEGEYDLISGLVGFGVYLLERLPNPKAVEGLERIVDHLEALAEPKEEGLAWFTPAERLPEWQREFAPKGYYNLGLAHGVPGIIGLLGELCGQNVAKETASPLLDGAVSWLLARRLPPESGSCYGTWHGPEVHADASRVAWCYGDLGLAVSLLLAARRVANAAWEQEAVAVARHSSHRLSEDAGVRDAGLCHGAAGNGHLFNRLYQATGVADFKDAARFWLVEILGMLKPGEGVGGVLSWSSKQVDDKPEWKADPGFLGGAAGVALALLAGARGVEPSWDRVMLSAVSPLGR